MPQRIEVSAAIDAPVASVFEVVADVARYPEFLPGVHGVAQEGDVFAMTVRLGPVDVSWKSRAVIQPYESIAVRLVEGPFEQMDVLWSFSELEGKTEVRCVTEYALLLPIPGIKWLKDTIVKTMGKGK